MDLFAVTLAIFMLASFGAALIAGHEFKALNERRIAERDARDVEKNRTAIKDITTIVASLTAIYKMIDNDPASTVSIQIEAVNVTFSVLKSNRGRVEQNVFINNRGVPDYTTSFEAENDAVTPATTVDTTTEASMDVEEDTDHSYGRPGIICDTNSEAPAETNPSQTDPDNTFSSKHRAVNAQELADTLIDRAVVHARPCGPGGFFCAAASVAERDGVEITLEAPTTGGVPASFF